MLPTVRILYVACFPLRLCISTALLHAGEIANELSALLNSAYATLSNLKAKEAYDDALKSFRREHAQYDGMPVSEWWGPPGKR